MKKIFLLASLAVYINAFSQIPSYVSPTGLLAWYSFTGNANDLSGNGNDGTNNGAALTTDRFGNTNSAYDFDGSSDYIVTALANGINISNQSFTWSAWIKHHSLTQNGENILLQGTPNTSTGLIVCFMPSNSLRFTFYNGDLDEDLPSIDTTNWVHFVGTYDATINQRKIYKNGVLNKTDNPGSDYSGTGVLYIGGTTAHAGWTSNSFNGKVDDIGIWNHTFSQQEVTQLFTGNMCSFADTTHVIIHDTTYTSIAVADTLLVSVPTGLNPPNNINSIKVFPNPAHDHIAINNGNLSSMTGYSIKITNTLGQIVFNQPINQQQFYIDVSTWGGSGTYILYVLDAGQLIKSTKEIVLQ